MLSETTAFIPLEPSARVRPRRDQPLPAPIAVPLELSFSNGDMPGFADGAQLSLIFQEEHVP